MCGVDIDAEWWAHSNCSLPVHYQHLVAVVELFMFILLTITPYFTLTVSSILLRLRGCRTDDEYGKCEGTAADAGEVLQSTLGSFP